MEMNEAPGQAMDEEVIAGPPANDVQASDEPPPRLMITKMVLENFKSYAGIKEIGPFHKCFSAVVGPNGSGKSNVIDAMLFVFGKRAKKLRLNKVRELIHKSDAVKDNPPNFARVSVYFQEIVDTGDGDDDYRVVPNTEVIVTRIAKQDNSSTYKLNGKNSSFKDIAVYLNSKGIDLDNNRFLILQGEVEMISMMPPKGKTEHDEGLLEYLEDIIGTSKFVEETNQAAEFVEALNEARQDKLHRVKAVEKEKDNLEGAKQEAEALLDKEREIRRQQSLLYQIYAGNAEKEMEKAEEAKLQAEQKLKLEREEAEELNVQLKDVQQSLSKEKEEYDTIYAELVKTKDSFAAYERKDIQLREEIKGTRAQIKKLGKKVDDEKKKLKSSEEKRDKAMSSIPVLEAKIEDLQREKSSQDKCLESIYEDVKGVTEGLRHQLESRSQELAPVKQELATFQAALDTAKEELRLFDDTRNRIQERLQASEDELSKLDETKQSKTTEYHDKADELRRAKESTDRIQSEAKELKDREVHLQREARTHVAKAEEAKLALQSTGGGTRSKAVAGIIKAARNGGELSKMGVLGRLGDLATIHEKYDVAVSTACGMLDSVVVQTTAGAQKCLEYLRAHNLGRANFIPLDKMKKGAHDRSVETPEGAPRLFDLITPSSYEVTPAVYLALGNTLVAPDLEVATRWAYEYKKRWRVVTMDGKLIETAGTMAGGGKSARRGGMRLSNARRGGPQMGSEDDVVKEVELFEKKASEAQAQLQQCRQRQKELSDELRGLHKVIKNLELRLPTLKLEIDGFDTTRGELSRLIPELKDQLRACEGQADKRQVLLENVAIRKSDMSSCEAMAEKLQGIVADLRQAILDAGGPRLQKQKQVCDELQRDLDDADKALNSARVGVKTAERAIAKAHSAVASCSKELEERENKLETLDEEFKSLDSGAMEVMQAYESVKVIEAKKRESLECASKAMEDFSQKLSSVKCVEVELLGQIETSEKQFFDHRKKKSHWDKEIEKLIQLDKESFGEFDVVGGDSDEVMRNGESESDEADEENEDVDQETVSFIHRLSWQDLQKYNVETIKEKISNLEGERSTLAKNANMGAIEEYRKKEADYAARVGELDAVTEERNEARRKHEDLRRMRLEMFMEGFGKITLKLKEMYQMITLGGDAELELVDSLDPFSEGIVFSVRPPKKSWKNISNLSGGEKTLSSLALVFALHHYKPTPLYVMDEIDAALDFKNVSIVANYIKERTKNAQFIIISLRNNMFELADRLTGIFKTYNCSKSVTIDPKSFGHLSPTPRNRPLADRSNIEASTRESQKDINKMPENNNVGLSSNVEMAHA